jgi:DNA-binding response OmpR family regulator
MDGYETAIHIKRRARTRTIPIIFLTAMDRDPSHMFRGYAAGAVDYLVKPYDPWIIRAKVEAFVQMYLEARGTR